MPTLFQVFEHTLFRMGGWASSCEIAIHLPENEISL
jgi:hypothetical protein